MKLIAEDLVKKYKNRTVVKGVSVNVEQGEIVGLLGPNGAGKTTSFYMIVGLIKPNGGRIFFFEICLLSKVGFFIVVKENDKVILLGNEEILCIDRFCVA